MLSPNDLYVLQEAVTDLQDVGPLDNLKTRLWEVFRLAMASEEADSLSHVERSNQLFLYDKLIAFMEQVEPVRPKVLTLRQRQYE